MKKISVREDIRRDGLAANFLMDESSISTLSKVIPGSIINIGYPGVCKEEENVCRRIVEKGKKLPTELALVGHAREDHLIKMATIANLSKNTSGNFWIPLSDSFLSKTLKLSPEQVLEKSKKLIKLWKKISNRPIDIALADATNIKEDLSGRLFYFYNELKKAGARSIIFCDSKGQGKPEKIKHLLRKFTNSPHHLEYHPHNDNGFGLENVKAAISEGVSCIGTSFFNQGERNSMIDPRDLKKRYNLNFSWAHYYKFKLLYQLKIGPITKSKKLLDKRKVITGTQYRLREYNKNILPIFGVTSDTYILKKILKKKNIENNFLEFLKNNLYKERKKYYTKKEIEKKFIQFKKLPEVSVIFSIYGNFDKRRLIISLNSLSIQEGIRIEPIVIESNLRPKFKREAEKLKIKYFFMKHKINSEYDPGEIRNFGAKMASGEFLYLNDSDIIFRDKFFLKNSINKIRKNENLAYYRPPMRKLLINYFEDFYKIFVKSGIRLSIDKLYFSQKYLAKLDKKKYNLKVAIPPGKEGVEEFIAHMGDYIKYKKNPSLKKLAPLFFSGTRHWGGTLIRKKQFEFLGGYHEGFKNWGCEDTDLQWKIENYFELKFFPKNKKYEVIHLDHQKEYFSSSMLKTNKKEEGKRKINGIINSIMEDRKKYFENEKD